MTAQLEQMVALLQLELSAGNNNAETRILDTILSDSDNILAQVVGWSKCLAPGHVAPVLTLSLSLCEVLVSCRQAGQSVLSHSRIVTPLLSLLDTVHSLNGAQPASPGLQTALLGLVHSLCVLLTESPSLLSHASFVCVADSGGGGTTTTMTWLLFECRHCRRMKRAEMAMADTVSLSSSWVTDRRGPMQWWTIPSCKVPKMFLKTL